MAVNGDSLTSVQVETVSNNYLFFFKAKAA